MSRIVIKFGGSDLKTTKDIERIIQIIKQYNRRVVIVASAFYGITDVLIKALAEAEKGHLEIEKTIKHLAELKRETIEKNVASKEEAQGIFEKVMKLISELQEYLKAVSYVHDVPLPSRALILSYGERISALCLSEILKHNGWDTTMSLPEDLKLITDGEFSNATVDFVRSNVKNNIPENEIVVVPGYYGISTEGKTTLLGRGGSDYAAAAIAYFIDAPSLDLWKDVKGFMSGDPKLVENPQCVKQLAYNEAAELSYFGAKILHPRTVEPLKIKNIPIHLHAINAISEPLKPASIISKRTDESKIVKSVTYSKDFGVLKLKGSGLGIKPGVLADVTNLLNINDININSVLTSQIAINFILNKGDLQKAKSLVEQLRIQVMESIEIWDKVALIAVVGDGIMDNYGISSRVFSAVTSEKINVKMNCSGASPIVNYFIVNEEDVKRAIRAVHRELFTLGH